ncbi:MAG TPA: PAC2 family protein [Methanocorpusculum sp.]|nr:PAC2 family protein [Methanocorpusculum sp.]
MDITDAVRVESLAPTAKEITLLTGFPGSGLVGSIALQYLVENAGFTHLGNITSRFLPQISLATNGLAQAPIRLYEKDNFVAVLADVPIPPQVSYEISAGLIEWLSGKSVITELVVIGGVTTGGDGERVFGVATTTDGLETIKEQSIILPALSITGISGSMIIEAQLRGIPAAGFLVETNFNVDPRAAIEALKILNTRYGFGIDTQPLMEQADQVEAMMHQLANDVQEQENAEQKPFSSAEQVMYG